MEHHALSPSQSFKGLASGAGANRDEVVRRQKRHGHAQSEGPDNDVLAYPFRV